MGRFWILSAVFALCATRVLAQEEEEIDRTYHKVGLSKRDTVNFLELVRRQTCICMCQIFNVYTTSRFSASLIHASRYVPLRHLRIVSLRPLLHRRRVLLLLRALLQRRLHELPIHLLRRRQRRLRPRRKLLQRQFRRLLPHRLLLQLRKRTVQLRWGQR